MADDVLDVPAPKKRGRPPKTPTIKTVAVADLTFGNVTHEDVRIDRAIVYQDVDAVIARHRAEVAAHETLDEARKNYALDLLDRLLADLRG